MSREFLQPSIHELFPPDYHLDLDLDQLHYFQEPENIGVQPGIKFVPEITTSILQSRVGKIVHSVDLGGDKVVYHKWQALDGGMLVIEEEKRHQASQGRGFVEFLESIADKIEGAPIGLSVAGQVNGSIHVESPNAQIYIQELRKKYGGNLKYLFGDNVCLLNDAVAGTVLATVRNYQQADIVILPIVGGGLGDSVWERSTRSIYPTEAGHAPLTPDLNKHNQQRICKHQQTVNRRSLVCLENIVGGTSISDIYHQLTGKNLSPQDIETQFRNGDQTAKEVYQQSVIGLVHMIKGVVNHFGDQQRIVVVPHGGVFKFTEYAQATEMLVKQVVPIQNFQLATNLSSNACSEGAAIAALTQI